MKMDLIASTLALLIFGAAYAQPGTPSSSEASKGNCSLSRSDGKQISGCEHYVPPIRYRSDGSYLDDRRMHGDGRHP
jgi:hypothetical protein